jgi:hypothetical protein
VDDRWWKWELYPRSPRLEVSWHAPAGALCGATCPSCSPALTRPCHQVVHQSPQQHAVGSRWSGLLPSATICRGGRVGAHVTPRRCESSPIPPCFSGSGSISYLSPLLVHSQAPIFISARINKRHYHHLSSPILPCSNQLATQAHTHTFAPVLLSASSLLCLCSASSSPLSCFLPPSLLWCHCHAIGPLSTSKPMTTTGIMNQSLLKALYVNKKLL